MSLSPVWVQRRAKLVHFAKIELQTNLVVTLFDFMSYQLILSFLIVVVKLRQEMLLQVLYEGRRTQQEFYFPL